MTPSIDTYLQELARALGQDLAPQQASAFAQGTLLRHAALVAMAAEEFDRAAARLVDENSAVRSLLARGAQALPGHALAAGWRELSGSVDASLRVRDLQHGNDALRAALIELHAALEEQSGARSADLLQAIWGELVQSTERRRLSQAAL